MTYLSQSQTEATTEENPGLIGDVIANRNVGTATSYTISASELTPGKTYYWQVVIVEHMCHKTMRNTYVADPSADTSEDELNTVVLFRHSDVFSFSIDE